MSFWGRKTFVTHSEIAILVDDLPYSKLTISPIPRFFGSNDSLDYANRWMSPHAEPPSPSDRKSCSTRREISSPVSGPNSSLGVQSRAADAIAYGRHFAQTGITFRSRLPQLRESLEEPTCGATQSQRSKVVFYSMRDLLPRSWIWVPEHRRYSHPLRFIPTPSAKELGITIRTGIGIAYVTTFWNRHSETVNRALVSRNFVPGPKFPLGACRLPRLRESLAEPTLGAAQSPRSEVIFNSMRDLLPRSWIWVPEHRRYSHPLQFIPTPSAKALGITFRTGIGITYVTTIRNWHSETVDRMQVLRNSVMGPKFTSEHVYQYTDCRTLWSDADIYSPGGRNPPRGPNSASAL
ncbi:hypothetical protein Taro_015387 [Colocasia esculenta]|uniref:Uncharacterized protein n=1 Tax=Colocasia esculenta TaxID=4460 RepID=A0A843UM05_COLES|nr:hypothetical protein [Colocasia esculenta]